MSIEKRLKKIEAVILPRREDRQTRINHRAMCCAIAGLTLLELKTAVVYDYEGVYPMTPERQQIFNEVEKRTQELKGHPDVNNFSISDGDVRMQFKAGGRR